MHHVVIGAGPSGVVAAETIRKLDPSAGVTLIGGEPEPPYSRMAIPYLLIDQIDESGTYLRRDESHFNSNYVEYKQAQVEHIRRGDNTLELSNGTKMSYDRLLIATGSTPVKPPIPGVDCEGVSHCWTLNDARKIIEKTQEGSRVVLMGAGFIGCIILEALARRGVDLTVVEMADRMVPRMMNLETGSLIKQWCESKGVTVLTSTKVESIKQAGTSTFAKIFGSKPGHVEVSLSNGSTIEADLVISATGVRPNIALAQDAELKCGTGITVDRYMQTSDPSIYASGDCAEGLDFSTDQFMVQAIQPTAADHARVAATNMVKGNRMQTEGTLNMNVLDTMGLISASFGAWEGVEGGQTAVQKDLANYKYMELQFDGDILVGANCLGHTQHIGVLRGLIQSKQDLSSWKARLMANPTRVMEAYLDTMRPVS